jgi:cysteine desulfurase/selenocysteine lyase
MSPFRSDFPIFQNIPTLVYLDSASTAQKPQAVVDAMVHCMTHTYANIHRGMYDISTQAEAIYVASKQAVCSVLHTTDTSEIVYTYNANYATNMLAQSM